MIQQPSTNGENGETILRDEGGRFIKGTRPGPGNPYVKAVAEWRAAMAKAISPADITAVVHALVRAGKAGKPWAVRAILDHCCGSLVECEIKQLIAELRAEAGLE